MSDDTVELTLRHVPADGTDSHPTSPEVLFGTINAQLDIAWAKMDGRGTVEGAAVWAREVHELLTLVQSLDGLATERVEFLRSTAEAAQATESGPDYDDVMARLHGGAS
jgi:hypothetical protein